MWNPVLRVGRHCGQQKAVPESIVLSHSSGVGTVTARQLLQAGKDKPAKVLPGLMKMHHAHKTELSSLFTFELLAWSVGASWCFPLP